jgi:hypothetical protein
MIVRYYDIKKYPFISEITNFFNVSSLEKIHDERKDLLPKSKLNFNTESITDFHSSYYAEQREGWQSLKDTYMAFIKDIIEPVVGEPIICQNMPTFRVQLPGEKAIHKWHYDSDDDHRHPIGEINFQIALTMMTKENATWCETAPRAEDFFPMVLMPGQFLQFDGNKCRHGNKENTSNVSRVSLDFRVLPLSVYDEHSAKSSLNANKKFIIGGYYKEVR